MIALIWILVWLAALATGAFFLPMAKGREKRWAGVASLMLALVGIIGLGVTLNGGAPTIVGPFVMGAAPITIAPAMMLGAIALVLLAGRAEASSNETSWLLGMLCFESVALLAGDTVLLIVAEGLATAVLAAHARRRGQRAHFAYLGFATLALALSLAVLAVSPIPAGAELPPVVAGLFALVAFVRLGIFPFSTGMLSSLDRGPTTATLMAALPYGGVLLLIRANPSLQALGISEFVVDWLLVVAPLAAALAITQNQLGRSLGYTLASTHALIALGALDPTPAGQLGGELLWAGALLTSTGFGAAANLVTLRIGSPDLARHHGLHASAPFLSLAFLVLGVGLAGAPGTVQFVAEDILLNTASTEGTLGMALVVGTIALIGFNVLRMQFRIFFGSSPIARSYLQTKSRERLGLIMVGGAVVLGGMAPSLLPLVSAAAQASGH